MEKLSILKRHGDKMKASKRIFFIPVMVVVFLEVISKGLIELFSTSDIGIIGFVLTLVKSPILGLKEDMVDNIIGTLITLSVLCIIKFVGNKYNYSLPRKIVIVIIYFVSVFMFNVVKMEPI